MSKKDEPEITEPVIAEIEEPGTKPEDEGVVVDLEKDKKSPETDQPKTEDKPKDYEDLRKIKNRQMYLDRQNEKLMKQNEQILVELQSLRQKKEEAPSVPTDEIDEVAQRDWKKGAWLAVEKQVDDRINQILKNQAEREKLRTRELQMTEELNRSKQRVLDRYPTLDEDDSEEAKIYRDVLNEDQSLLSNLRGPEIAMWRMEEKMREMGKTPASLKPVVEREVNRRARAGANGVSGRQVSPKGKVVLTREQKELCDYHGINYEDYARTLKATEASGDRSIEA